MGYRRSSFYAVERGTYQPSRAQILSAHRQLRKVHPHTDKISSKGYMISLKTMKRTDKAICLVAGKAGADGKLQRAFCWFPLSQVHPTDRGLSVPDWLFLEKQREGYRF